MYKIKISVTDTLKKQLDIPGSNSIFCQEYYVDSRATVVMHHKLQQALKELIEWLDYWPFLEH